MKNAFIFATLAVAVTTLSGCSIPVYEKSITSEYNASGELIGTSVTETIRQPSPNSSPMKVNITEDKLEK